MSETSGTGDEKQTLSERLPWRRIASVVGLLVLLAVVIPFVIYAVPQVVGGQASYVVLSGSMAPLIGPGDAIITDGVNPADVEAGDIITFGEAGDERPTTHRVVEVVQQDGGPAFRTKGDAVQDADPQLVSPDQVDGRVMSLGGFLLVIPFIGHIIQFVNTPVGFAALFVVPVVLLVATEIWSIATSARSDADSDDSSDPVGAGSVEGEHAATDPEDAERAGATDEGSETDDGGVTFTAPELQLGLVVLAAFLVYSGWVAYVTREIWSFAVAGSVATTFLLLAAVYVVGGGDGGDDSDTTTPTDDSGGEGGGYEEIGYTTPEVDVEEEVAMLEELLASGDPEATPRANGGGGSTAAGTTDEASTQPAITRVDGERSDEPGTGSGSTGTVANGDATGGEPT